MARLTNTLLALTAASGLLVWGAESWGPLYRWNLLLHPLLGVAATIALVGYGARHLRDKLKGHVRVGAAGLALLFALPAAGIVAGRWVETRSWIAWLPALLALGVLFRPVRAMVDFVVERLRHMPAVVLGTALLIAWTAALASGVALLPWTDAPAAHDAFVLHRTLATITAGLLVAHLVGVRLYRAEAAGRDAPREDAELRAGLVALAAAAGLGLAVWLGDGWLARRPRVEVALSRSPAVAPFSSPGFASPVPATAIAGLAVVDGCGRGAGCHADVVADHARSNHVTGSTTPHFRKNLALLEAEVGAGGRVTCQACHAPLAALASASTTSTARTSTSAAAPEEAAALEGAAAFGCVSCHAITEVDAEVDYDVGVDVGESGVTRYVLEPPLAHLALFRPDPDGELTPMTRLLLRLNPIGHGRALTSPLLDEDRFCLACHAHEIVPSADDGRIHPRCVQCHMPARSMLTLEGETATHLFPGANLAVPAAAGDGALVATLDRWLARDPAFRLYVKEWGAAWGLREPGYADGGEEYRRQHPLIWLRSALQVTSEGGPGERFAFEVRSENVGMEHAFPAAPLDLLDAWLEVRVTDLASGRVLLEQGTVDAAGRVDPAAARLGGHVLDERGERLARHRIWVHTRDVVDRVIAPGETIAVPFALDLPVDVGDALRIEARWRYRKLAQPFADWAYGLDADDRPRFRAPIATIDELDVRRTIRRDPALHAGGGAVPGLGSPRGSS